MTAEPLSFPDLSLDDKTAPKPGRVRLGSDAHKNSVLPHAADDVRSVPAGGDRLAQARGDARERLTSLPIWDIAVQTEGKAGLRVATYGEQIHDSILRQAIALNAFEERRHKHVLHNMVEAYGIALQPEPAYLKPRDAEWAFMVTGYSECIDSFFAFGLFETAKRSGFFPPELVDTFEPVMRKRGDTSSSSSTGWRGTAVTCRSGDGRILR
jgi:hypothetical protein